MSTFLARRHHHSPHRAQRCDDDIVAIFLPICSRYFDISTIMLPSIYGRAQAALEQGKAQLITGARRRLSIDRYTSHRPSSPAYIFSSVTNGLIDGK